MCTINTITSLKLTGTYIIEKHDQQPFESTTAYNTRIPSIFALVGRNPLSVYTALP